MESIPGSPMFLSHGGRPTKGNGRKRKGVDEYAAENRVDFTSRSIIRDGQLVRILVCRFCCQSIGARSDRIKEHLASKRHQKLKLEAFREAAEAGRDLTQEYSDADSVAALLPEPSITMLKFPGKALAHLLDGGGDGRHPNREMTPEAEDRKRKMPTPPPLREHVMSSPPPQIAHPGLQVHGGLQSSGQSMANNMSGGRLSSGPNSSGTPPPQGKQHEQKEPQQLLCVRWGNFDSNIVSMFTKLRALEHFVDATLWCEGKTIKCHKIILSACSTYFEKLLTENPNPHPIIFLKDMRFWEITALVEFMYKGEVSIHQEKLQSLLQAAESLQIKGLGSPSPNDGAGVGSGVGGSLEGREGSGMDDEVSMDMSTASNNNNTLSNNNNNSSHHNQNSNNNHNSISSSLSHLHNHREDRSSVHGALASNLANMAHVHSNSPVTAALNAHTQSLLNSMQVGMDLSNHGSGAGSVGSLGLSNIHSSSLPLALSLQSALNNNNNNIINNQSGSIPAKRRKKETPRRLDVPRANLPVPVFNSTMASDTMEDDVEENASDDSMAAHERNHVDVSSIDGFKQEMNQEMTYEDEEDGEGQENYAEQDPGSQMDDDRSDSEHGGDVDDEDRGGGHGEETDESGALSLRVTSAAERDRLERERSRKGNPIKKIHIGNNNNNEIHSASTGGD